MATPGTESDTAVQNEAERGSVLHRLYTGTGAFDIVGKRKRWYLLFGALLLVCIGTMGFKGFNLGIDFEGGTKIQMPAVGAQGQIEPDQVQDAFQDAVGKRAETVQIVGSGATQSIQIRTETLSVPEVSQVKQELFDQLRPIGVNGEPNQQSISDSAVSGTWGSEITEQALIALGVFLVLVTVFLALYFEKWMAVAALLALLHDVAVTAGIYAILGFEVTPSTVIGLLTILGFSLYDTVVVFDKVKENTRGLLGLTRRTYAEAANLAVNQTLMRSINTSIVALLPVLGLLVVGFGMLGVGVLRDLALVQLVGMLAGVVSSILLATPMLVDFKMREPKYKAQAEKVRQRRERGSANGSANTARSDSGGRDDERDGEHALAGASSSASRTEARRSNNRPAGKAGRPSGKKRR
ncbi:protein translocase subunit SecF [Parasphingorhabdus pacifica]